MTAKTDTKVGVRIGQHPTESQSHSRIAVENLRKSDCRDTLDFHRKNTNSPLVIPLREYEGYNKTLRGLCDAGVAEGAFVILDVESRK